MDKLLQGLKNTTQKAKTTLKDWLSVDEGETSPSVVERAGQTIQDIFKKDVVKPVPQDGKEYISPAVRTPIQKVADKIRSTETGNILMDAFLGDGTNDYFKGKIDGKEQGFSLLPKQGEGLIEYLLPETTKDDTTRILERYDDLKEKGVGDERATKVAVEDVFKPKAGSMEQFMATKEGKKDDLTDEEKGVLRKKNLMETLGLGLDVIGNTPFGAITKKGGAKVTGGAIKELEELAKNSKTLDEFKNAIAVEKETQGPLYKAVKDYKEKGGENFNVDEYWNSVKVPTKDKVEYILPKDITLYRGEGKGIGNTTFVKGKYYADSKDFAKTFGDNIEETILPKGTKVFDFDAIKNKPDQKVIPQEILVDPEKTRQFLLDKGYTVTKNTNTRGVEYVMLDALKPVDELANIAKNFNTKREFLEFLAGKGYNENKKLLEKTDIGDKDIAWNQAKGLDFYGNKIGAKETVKKVAPKAKKEETLYHGTSAGDFDTFGGDLVYLTKNKDEAKAFAENPIIGGGRGKGTQRVLEVKAPQTEQNTKDINDVILDAMENGDDIDVAIQQQADVARKQGYEYLSFMHPSSVGDGANDFEAFVALNPKKLNIGNKATSKLVEEAPVKVPKRISESVRKDIINEDFTKIEGIEPSNIKKVQLFGSSVEGKANPNDIDVFVTVSDDAYKWKKRGGMIQPLSFERGKFSYIVMPESEGSDLLSAMLYTGRKDGDRAYSGTAVTLPKKLWTGNKTEVIKEVAKTVKKSKEKVEGLESVGDILKRTTDGGSGTTKTMGDIFTGEAPSKTRRFTVRTEKLAPESKPFLQGKYQAKSNKNLIEEADNIIAKSRDEAEIIAKTDSSDRGIAVASRLLDTLTQEAKATKDINAKNAIYEKIADISNETARNLTEAGRSIQAATILGRLTPEGMVRYAARQIQKHNERVAKGTLGDMFGGYGKKLEKIPELTGEEVAWIQREMERIGKITDEIQKAKEFQAFDRKMSERIPSSFYSKIATLWKAGLLTGLKTSGLNILSNSAHALSEGAKDIPAVLVDKIISLFTGKRTLALTGKGSGQGAREGVAKGWEYLKTGFDERDIGGKLDYERVNFGKGKVAKLLQKYEEGVFRLIGSQDQPFYYGAKARSLYSQAIAEARNKGLVGEEATKFVNDLVANPTDDMLKYATLDAETAVFQNLTALGTAGRAIQNIPYVGKFILPFAKTPSAVATQLLAYSPLGIVGTLAKYARKGKFDQRLFSQGMGRGLTGTGVMYIGATLYDSGNLALSMPTTEREKKQWELEGKKPNSIKIGDKWVSVAVLGPAGLALLVGGAYRKAYDEAGSVAKGMLQASIGGVKSFGEQTFLKGINQFTNALSDPERYGTPFFSSFIGSWIPTIVADVARATDDYERRSPGLLGKLQSRIPGIREALQPQVDTFGNEIKTPSAVRVMVDATRSSDVKPSDNVTKELRRLMDAGYPATPTQVGPRDGYKTLTPSQNTQLLKISGNLEKTRLAKLMQSEAYKKADDELREKAIQREVDRAKVEARARVIYDAVSGLSKEQRIQRLKEMKDEKLLTKQVFSAYQSIKNNK